MKSEFRKIVPISDEHAPIVAMASFKGVNVEPVIEGGSRFIGYGQSTHGFAPICIVDVKETPYVAEPHVTWLPWVSNKEKIRAFMFAMRYYSNGKQVLLIIGKDQMSFFEHFVKSGVLRKIGVMDNLPKEAGEEIHFYQVNKGALNE